MAIKELKRFDIKSLVKVYTFLFGAIGLILGVVYAFLGVGPDAGTGFNINILFITFIIYIVLGVFCALLTGFLYNYIAKKIGGIKIDLK